MDHTIYIESGSESTMETEEAIVNEQVNRKRKRATDEDDRSDRPCPLSVKRRRLLKRVKRQAQGMRQQIDGERPPSETASTSEQDQLRMYNHNIMALKRQVAMLVGRQKHRESSAEQSREERHFLQMIQSKMCQMEKFEVSFHKMKKHFEEHEAEQLQEHLKCQIEDALQEQKVMQKLLDSRQNLQDMVLAKNKELEKVKEKAEQEKLALMDVMENELLCAVCSEYLIQPCTLNCSHTFCSYCITTWRMKRNDCPICRKSILTQTRCLMVDNLIDGMLEKLSPDIKATRQVAIDERRVLTSNPRL